jgi:cyclohexanecarboxylate-CoA ligase
MSDGSLWGGVERWATRKPSQLAVVSDQYSLSYRDLMDRARAFTAEMIGQDQGAPTHLIISTVEPGAAAVAQLAASLLGVSAVWGAAPTSLDTPLQSSGPRYSASVSSSEMPGAPPGSLQLTTAEPAMHQLLEKVSANATLDSPAVVFHTSGTTSRPRLVVHTEASLLRGARAISNQRSSSTTGNPLDRLLNTRGLLHRFGPARSLRGRRNLTWASALPMSSIGAHSILYQVLLGGGTFVSASRFRPTTMLDLLDKSAPSVLACTPAMADRMARTIGASGRPAPELLAVNLSGELPTAELIRRVGGAFQCAVIVTYGLTEVAGPVVSDALRPSEFRAPSSIGRPLTGVETRVVTPTGANAGLGLPGVLHIRCPSLMVGHVDQGRFVPADRHGWFSTGDLVAPLSSGELLFLGRSDDIVQRDGRTIRLGEVEAVLAAMPGIEAAAAIGVQMPSGRTGLRAFLVESNGCTTNDADVRHRCAAAIGAGIRPDVITRIPSLPSTHAGKLDRPALSAIPISATTAPTAESGIAVRSAAPAAGRPLGILERGQVLAGRRWSAATLARVIVLDEVVPVAAVSKAATAAVVVAPSLSLRISADRRQLYPAPPTAALQVEHIGPATPADLLHAAFARAWPSDRDLIRVAVAAGDRSTTTIVVSAHHAVVDGRTMSTYCNRLIEGLDAANLRAVAPNLPTNGPAPVDAYLPHDAMARFGRYAQATRSLEHQTPLAQWMKPSSASTVAVELLRGLDLRPGARALGCTVHGVLAKALITAVGSDRPVSLVSTVDLRQSLGCGVSPETSGFYVSGVRTEHEASNPNLAHEVSATVKAAIRRGDTVGTIPLQSAAIRLAARGFILSDLVLTNLGPMAPPAGGPPLLATFGGATAHTLGSKLACFAGTSAAGLYLVLVAGNQSVLAPRLSEIADQMSSELKALGS